MTDTKNRRRAAALADSAGARSRHRHPEYRTDLATTATAPALASSQTGKRGDAGRDHRV